MEEVFGVPMDIIIIDLKSFYASVECVERGMDPMAENLVVADPTRNKGTICLAITPAMKALGVKNRCRVYEIPEHIKYIMAPPRMDLYLRYSSAIYKIYLKYISKEDIHVYSVDEAFMDVTPYLIMYQKTAKEIGQMILSDIKRTTGLTATCGVGTNLYLAKVALDIVSKHSPDFIGVLDEKSYIEKLWNHKPLTDFWRIGPGTQDKLAHAGIFTQRDIAEADPKLIHKLFGVDGELLQDHAWGRETTTMKDIKSYESKDHSVSMGQVLLRDYEYAEAMLVAKEMADLICLDLVDKNLITDSISLYVGYSYTYGIPGTGYTISLTTATNSPLIIIPEVEIAFRRTTLPNIAIRNISICAQRVFNADMRQYDLLHDPAEIDKINNLQKAVLAVKKRYGKNALLKGMNLLDGGTTIERNNQIGGHKAGRNL